MLDLSNILKIIIFDIIISILIVCFLNYNSSSSSSDIYRICGISVRDVIGTLISSVILSYFIDMQLIYIIIIQFLLAPIIHYIFNVNTMFNYYIGICDKPISSIEN